MIVPSDEISRLPSTVKTLFLRWTDVMDIRVRFNMPDSELHAAAHCERVLLYALLAGNEIYADDAGALEILAHAAIFHDTCRQDEYLDTGHGARAAVYYSKFCDTFKDIEFHNESAYLMRYHDLDDNDGRKAIACAFPVCSDKVAQFYSIFKDADALDRWRLGRYGLDTRYLRTDAARSLTGYARNITEQTVPVELRKSIEAEMEQILAREKRMKT